MKKNNRLNYTTFSKEFFYADIEVVEIDKIVDYPDECKTKTTFYSISANGNKILCVVWKKTTFNVGDKLRAFGRLKNNGDIFAISSYQIIKRGRNEQI